MGIQKFNVASILMDDTFLTWIKGTFHRPVFYTHQFQGRTLSPPLSVTLCWSLISFYSDLHVQTIARCWYIVSTWHMYLQTNLLRLWHHIFQCYSLYVPMVCMSRYLLCMTSVQTVLNAFTIKFHNFSFYN